ncbi:hypothetical protein [Bauldia sp.]|uniref:hypothetical protein n=1 Tax=Bauldia sp. TaxID=2575872 RepID=UPI003BA978B0
MAQSKRYLGRANDPRARETAEEKILRAIFGEDGGPRTEEFPLSHLVVSSAPGEPPDQQLAEVSQVLEVLERRIASIGETLGAEKTGEPKEEEGVEIITGFLANAQDSDVATALESNTFAIDDVMLAALRSLERSNQAAEEAIVDNGRASRLFDHTSRMIDADQRRLQADLEALVGG